MKKLFFTAITLIAFSGITIAKNKDKNLLKEDFYCSLWAAQMAAADEDEFGCMSSAEYSSSYYFYLTKCNNH